VLAQPAEHLPEGLKLKKWAPGTTLHLSFDGSPAISPFKVYPAAEDWFAQNRKKISPGILEIYDLKARGQLTTHYYFPLEPSTESENQ
jgi:hypothetical protein